MAPSEAMRRPLTNVRPWNSMVSPGLSSVPANRLPIMTASAPAAMALVMSPENLMPPSAINGTPAGPVAREHSAIAVSCGTPAPETTRVVQIDPGPIPTLMPSTPSEINSQAPSYVATFPVMSCTSGRARLSAFTAAMTRSVCPWAVSMASTSTLRATSSCARSRKSLVAPMAAPTRRRPCSSLAAYGYFNFFWISLTVITHGHEALHIVVIFGDHQVLHAVLVQDGLGFLQRGADGHGDEVVLGHHIPDRHIRAGLESKIAGRQDVH